MEIAVRVPREPRLLDTGRLPEPRPREDRGHVEVEPPEGRDDDDRECRGDDDARRQLEAGTDADRNDRLAERDQDDKTVPLREVLGRNPPAAPGAENNGADIVDRKRNHPDRDARVPLEE